MALELLGSGRELYITLLAAATTLCALALAIYLWPARPASRPPRAAAPAPAPSASAAAAAAAAPPPPPAEGPSRAPSPARGDAPLAAPFAPDFGPPITGDLRAWRAASPRATAANVAGRADLAPADFAALRGLRAVAASRCDGLTGAALAHLRGARALALDGCGALTDADAAPLAGVAWLDVSHTALGAGLAAARGVETLIAFGCAALDDAALAGVVSPALRRLDASYCAALTDAGLAALRGAGADLDVTLDGCAQLGDAAFAHLGRARAVRMRGLRGVTPAAVAALAGAETVVAWGCRADVVAAADARRPAQ
jgi:hypothetical protein